MVALFDSIGVPAIVLVGGHQQQVLAGERLERTLPADMQRELYDEVQARRNDARLRSRQRDAVVFRWRGWQVRVMDVSPGADRALVIGLLELLPTSDRWAAVLTPRQREIAEAAAAGEASRALAQRFGLSIHTVRRHLEEIYRRLGVSRRAELARLVTVGRDRVA
jgi:DNA-binding CsgD family transcriptional regulator